MSQGTKQLFVWLFVLIGLMLVYDFARQSNTNTKTLSYSQFLDEVKSAKVGSVEIDGSNIQGTLKDSQRFETISPKEDKDLISTLMAAKVDVNVKEPSQESWIVFLLVNILPLILIVALFIFFMRQMQSGAGKGMNFGKSRAKLITDNTKVTFKDVAGIDEARAELQEIVEFLKDPKKFTRLGGRIPKGVLLIGAPGTGKTLLAKAIAGEAGVPFFSISGSDFVELFVGVGASRVRDLFTQGKKNAPCIIFIDEIDAVGRHRGAGMGGGHDEREQTLNQLLVEMDGFEGTEGLILIAATNRPDVLDPALLRPGRFDRRVIVPNPDLNGRIGILNVHVKKVPLSTDVDLKSIARGTPGFSGADLENLVNEAALNAARKNQDNVTKVDFEFAKDKVMMGAERRSMLLTDKEKETTAYHEAGHALVAKLLPNADPVHKLTIVPRGMALGLMQQLPETDKHTYSLSYWLDTLAVLFGGRVAEELVFNDINTGASSDIDRATNIARRMVTEWGMSEAIGPVSYAAEKEDQVFLGRGIGKSRDYSESIQEEIDREVRRIIEGQKAVAKKLISENIGILHTMAKAVIERETLDADIITAIVEGKEIPVFVPIVDTTTPVTETVATPARAENDSMTEEVVKPLVRPQEA